MLTGDGYGFSSEAQHLYTWGVLAGIVGVIEDRISRHGRKNYNTELLGFHVEIFIALVVYNTVPGIRSSNTLNTFYGQTFSSSRVSIPVRVEKRGGDKQRTPMREGRRTLA